jgi:hypothetical protein
MYTNHKPTSKINISVIVLLLGGILWILTDNFMFFVLGIRAATAYDKRDQENEI